MLLFRPWHHFWFFNFQGNIVYKYNSPSSSCPLWSAPIVSSPALGQTYQGFPPVVRRTQRWTLHYDVEMFIQLLMFTVIVCKSLAIKIHIKRLRLALIKKTYYSPSCIHLELCLSLFYLDGVLLDLDHQPLRLVRSLQQLRPEGRQLVLHRAHL